MRTTLQALSLGLVLTLPTAALADDTTEKSDWIADFDQAVEVAKKEGKDLLVDFTGSDWCGWCIKLHDEVFSKEDFLATATSRYVLVALDFPRAQEVKDKVPNPERNKELQVKYGVRGFPTVLMMNPDGEVYAKTGYRAGGSEKYVEHVKEILTEGPAGLKQAGALEKAFESAEGEKRAELATQAVDALAKAKPWAAYSDKLVAGAKVAMELDAQNEKGLKLRAVKALMGAGKADDAVVASATELDPKNEHGLYEQVVQRQFGMVRSKEAVSPALEALEKLDALGALKDKDVAEFLYIRGAVWNFKHADNPERARKYARKLRDMEIEENAQLKGLLDEILADTPVEK